MTTRDTTTEVRSIQTTNGKTVKVSDEDYALVSQYSWYALPRPNGIYYARVAAGEHQGKSMHRMILSAPAGTQIDHRDRDGLNNTRSNLRFASHHSNRGNSTPRYDNVSGFKGVAIFNSHGKRTKQWRAQIGYHGRTIHLGLFLDPAEAARAYDAKARELFGEFARLNFND